MSLDQDLAQAIIRYASNLRLLKEASEKHDWFEAEAIVLRLVADRESINSPGLNVTDLIW